MMRLKPKTNAKAKFMLPDECERWFAAMEKVSKPFYEAAITQVDGLLRVSEVFAMKWCYYNQTNETYRVCEHVFWSSKKGAVPPY